MELRAIQNQLAQFKYVKHHIEFYQRRESLRVSGIKEAGKVEEDMREVLVDFLKTEQEMEDADKLEFKGYIGLEIGTPPTKKLGRFFS